MIVMDMDGNKFLDFSAGIAVCATGHCHPRIVRAIQEQAARLIHMSGTDFYYPELSELAQKLAEITPGDHDKKVYFGNSGTEAIEAAMKLARYVTGRQRFIAFYNAFHGRTYGSLSLTASKPVQRKKFGPFLEGVTHIPFPSTYRCLHGGGNQDVEIYVCECSKISFSKIWSIRKKWPRSYLNLYKGRSGYVVPPKDFLLELRTADKIANFDCR